MVAGLIRGAQNAMKQSVVMLMAAGLVAAVANGASAQSRAEEGRVYVSVNGGFEAGNETLSDSRSFVYEREAGSYTFTTEAGGGALFDMSAGVRVWRALSVGIGYHRVSGTNDGTVAGTVPHPLFFDRPRSFSERAGGLDRTEQAVHFTAGWTVPFGEKIDVMVFGGPSQFRVTQDVVSSVNPAEVGPPYTSLVIQPQVTEQKESTWGAHIGADVSYLLIETVSARISVGGFARYAGGSTDIEILDNEVKTSPGGFQLGGGVRLRF
jgi:hypothetical protein